MAAKRHDMPGISFSYTRPASGAIDFTKTYLILFEFLSYINLPELSLNLP